MKLWFLLKEGLSGFKRARLASFITITSVALALLLVGYFLLFSTNMNRWIGAKRSQMELEVFLENAIRDKEGREIVSKIRAIEGVAEVRFVSKEDAARRFQREFGRNIYDILESNPLPPSCTLKLKPGFQTTRSVAAIEKKIRAIEGVNDVVYARELFYLIDRYVTWIYLALGAFGLVLLTIAVILLFNTIRLTIFARRDIIEIMTLVGATTSFIKSPFIIEGFFQGLLGAMLASGMLFGTGRVIRQLLYRGLIAPDWIYLAVGLCGILIGMLASHFSLSRYLDQV